MNAFDSARFGSELLVYELTKDVFFLKPTPNTNEFFGPNEWNMVNKLLKENNITATMEPGHGRQNWANVFDAEILHKGKKSEEKDFVDF